VNILLPLPLSWAFSSLDLSLPSSIVGAFVLIGIIIPYFLVAVAALIFVYHLVALCYRSSARELKRLDALLRS
jgi:hypothetical protein